MAGGVTETDPAKLARHCDSFMLGAKRLYDGERVKAMKGDMWLFELYHHLEDCAVALRKASQPHSSAMGETQR